MRRRDEPPSSPETVNLEAGDAVNEMILIAAAMVDPRSRAWLVEALRPETFLVEDNRAVWEGIQEIERRRLDYDHAVLQQLLGSRLRAGYAEEVLRQRPEPPDRANLEHHVRTLLWDHQRAHAIRGPINELLEALRDPAHPPERVRALGDAVGLAFRGAGSSSLEDPRHLVSRQVHDLRERTQGRAIFPYGIPGLDRYEAGMRSERGDDIGGRARLSPGAAPGMLTVVTANTGGGKSTLAARIALGLSEMQRKVLYCAWEPGTGMTIELLATMKLGWSRSDMLEGRGIGGEEIVAFEEACHEVARFVTLMRNPFQRARRSGKRTNEHNLDVLQQHVVDSGCHVWFADLWDRLLVEQYPSDVKNALDRTHAICEETLTHGIPLVQQNYKGEQVRGDRKPHIGNIFGSSEWGFVAETILAPYLPALYKKCPNDKMLILVLKQRWGVYPQSVEFQWDPEFGSIEGGVTIPHDHLGEEASDLGAFVAPEVPGGKRKRR
jgi:DnaB-like helicase N terminal domain